jgi:hypothetical protein
LGLRIADFGLKSVGHRAENGEVGKVEGGSGTRRRPIGRDYAAAKDAEFGSGTRRRPIGRDYAAAKDAE